MPSGCHLNPAVSIGLCSAGPLVVLEPQGLFYTKVRPNRVARIVSESVFGDKVIEVDGLAKHMGDKQLIEDLSFSLPPGAKVVRMSLEGNRLLVHYDLAGTPHASIYDLANGRRLSGITFQTDGAENR